MNRKLIAIGNVLMGDDGIAVAIAIQLAEQLRQRNIEVILGETDIGYCISSIQEGDYLILLDAAHCNKQPGEISILPLQDYMGGFDRSSPHDMSILKLLCSYYPCATGMLLAVEIAKEGFGYGLSVQLQSKIPEISDAILEIIDKLPDME